MDLIQAISCVWSQWRQQHQPLAILIVLCLNVVVDSVVYPAANKSLERRST